METLRITNPATGEAVGEVAVTPPDEVPGRVERARAAQVEWAGRPMRLRKAALERFHELCFDHQDRILDTIQRETGKTRRDAYGEFVSVPNTARYYAARGARYLADEVRSPAVPGLTTARVIYRPHGVVGFITPWNYPFLLAVGDALPALLAGNAAVIKPSEVTPLSADLAVELLHEAGFPADLVSCVHGPGPDLGPPLIAAVDYVAFTGSAATGRRIAVAAADRLLPYSLELGGKNPMVVLEGAPLEAAVDGLMTAAFFNCGQTCIAVERVYVERPIFDRFAALAAERARALDVGWSLAWEHDVGSQVSAAHAAKVRSHVDDALARGARRLTGEARDDLPPTFIEPTVLTDVPDSALAHGEETFGPVVSLYPVDSADEAVARANDTPYGLNASVWTANGHRSTAIARRIDAGSIGVNSALTIFHATDAPMGGVKRSGIGRRHGREGILRFVRSHSIVTSSTVAGGYEGLLTKLTSPGRVRWLSRIFRWRRRIPGLR